MSEKERILVVDDDESTCKSLRLIFGEKGYETEVAGSGREAMEKAQGRAFNAVLLDIKLPDIEGIELIGPFKEMHPDTVVVMITAWPSLETLKRALNEGASAYITKPLNMDEVLAAVEEALEKQRLIRQKRQAEEALAESHQKVESLHEVARQLATCETEEEVYQLTVEAAERLLDFSICSLEIAEGDKLVVKAASSGLPTGASRVLALDEGLAGKTYRSGRTHVFGGSDKALATWLTGKGLKSGIGAPIGDLGVFQVASTEIAAFTKYDARLLELLLGHTVQAVKRIRLQSELKERAIYDPLTHIYNRYYLNQALEQETKRSRRYNHAIAFLMVDINRFKEINDRFGHQTGDKVLQNVASSLLENVRRADIVVRYGGDEFLIMLPETDGEADMVKRRIAESVACRNETEKLLDFPITLSIGSAYWSPEGPESVEEVLHKADRQMYEEKRRQVAGAQSSQAIQGLIIGAEK